MRHAVTYRIDGGKCQTGFAVQTCDGAKVYATATGGEPIAGAVVVPFEQCPDEVAMQTILTWPVCRLMQMQLQHSRLPAW